jgi:hypothetical protein
MLPLSSRGKGIMGPEHGYAEERMDAVEDLCAHGEWRVFKRLRQ